MAAEARGGPDVWLRADASATIGAGHVMRCLALADELGRRGRSVGFACRTAPGDLVATLEARGLAVVRLDGPTDQAADAAQTVAAVRAAGARPGWIVVDHYGLDHGWEAAVRQVAERVLVIDDLTDRRHACDVLLNQNLSPARAEVYRERVPEDCARLLGPRFALLRREFAGGGRLRQGPVGRVMLMFGGADPTDETSKALEGLLASASRLPTDVVVGRAHPDLPRVERLTAALGGATLHVQSADVAALMRRADLAIGAAGVSTWERCAVGLPSLAIVVADNQEAVATTMEAAGAGVRLGWHAAVGPREIAAGFERVLADEAGRVAMSRAGLALVDGLGAARVADAMSAAAAR
jgi:UDP-2,4-diacetamido-2,4,6-trideoxy-beta-L-altropyranose hydrolase